MQYLSSKHFLWGPAETLMVTDTEWKCFLGSKYSFQRLNITQECFWHFSCSHCHNIFFSSRTKSISSPCLDYFWHFSTFQTYRYNTIWAMTWQNLSSGASDQARHKPACAATEASYNLEISAIEYRDIILTKQRTTKVLIRLCGCAGWSASLLFAYDIRHIFSWPGSFNNLKCFLSSFVEDKTHWACSPETLRLTRKT